MTPEYSTAQESGQCLEPADVVHEALLRPDVLLEVFCRLPTVADLAHASFVSRAWRAAARQDLAWKHVYVRQYGEPHAWEACGSFRDQCARRAGLRLPHRAPPLPGHTIAPCGQLEEYDSLFHVRTLAVSYDPVTGALLRAIRSRVLLGDTVRVAVQRIPLGAGAGAGAGSGFGHGAQTTFHGAGKVDRPEAAAADAAGSETSRTRVPTVAGQHSGTAQVDAAQLPSADRRPVESYPSFGKPTAMDVSGRAQTIEPWVCWLSTDGIAPALPPPLDDEAESTFLPAELADAAQGAEAALPLPLSAAAAAPRLTAAEARQIERLSELLPTVMCSAGGLLYLPAGPMGRGLAVWNLQATPLPAACFPAPGSETCTPTVAPMVTIEGAPGQGDGPSSSAPAASGGGLLPYWLVPEAHPGRLLAAAADGGLAVSGCDCGQLRFWSARRRVSHGSADISHLTRTPVMLAFPQPAAQPGAGRHRLRLALCEASGVAAVLLASPLSPVVYVYRAVPTAASAASATATAAGSTACGRDGGGKEGGGAGAAVADGVGQLLTKLAVGGAPGDGLALFRGCLLTMSVLCSDVMGARYGGSGGSSVLVTMTVRVWKVPSKQRDPMNMDGRDDDDHDDGDGSEADEKPQKKWGQCVQLFSSRLQLEHPRTLVLGRMRPQLAATEDLLLLTAPRGVGGRPPHHQLLALECAFGAELRSHQGFVEGQAQGPVVSEEDRLPWMEVIEDADEVVVVVLPTPYHLALLSEEGRLRLYGIKP